MTQRTIPLIEFLERELETRKRSHLPNPDEDEQGYIAEAQTALDDARKLYGHAEAMASASEKELYALLREVTVQAYRSDFPAATALSPVPSPLSLSRSEP